MQILKLETQNFKSNNKLYKRPQLSLKNKADKLKLHCSHSVWIVLSSKQRLRIRKQKPDGESSPVKLHLHLLNLQQPKHQIKSFQKPNQWSEIEEVKSWIKSGKLKQWWSSNSSISLNSLNRLFFLVPNKLTIYKRSNIKRSQTTPKITFQRKLNRCQVMLCT